MREGYRSDLAFIHDTGFGDLATSAARMILHELSREGSESGLVVDIGCGSGILARLFCDAGFNVLGFDLSCSLIEIARECAPGATFRVDSYTTADIPPCLLVTAIGEVFNYTFDPKNCAATRHEVFRRIYSALPPNGLLVFDMAGPARAPSVTPQKTFTEGPDWTVLAEVECDSARGLLTRRITTFRRSGELYRRDAELHQLQLVEPTDIAGALQSIGFEVRMLTSYGSFPLPKGLVGFWARKPGFVTSQ